MQSILNKTPLSQRILKFIFCFIIFTILCRILPVITLAISLAFLVLIAAIIFKPEEIPGKIKIISERYIKSKLSAGLYAFLFLTFISSSIENMNNPKYFNKINKVSEITQESLSSEEKEINKINLGIREKYKKNGDKVLESFYKIESINPSIGKFVNSVGYDPSSDNYCSGIITVNNIWFYQPKAIRLQLAQNFRKDWVDLMWVSGFINSKKDFCNFTLKDRNENTIGGNSAFSGVYVND